MSTPTEAPRPRAVLVGVQLPGVSDADQRSSLNELKRLCATLGFEVVGEVTQKRKGLGAATLLGQGKLVELAAMTRRGGTWRAAVLALTTMGLISGCAPVKRSITSEQPVTASRRAPDARLPPGARAQLPIRDGEPFFVTLPVRRAEDVTVAEVRRDVVDPLLSALGFAPQECPLVDPPGPV